MHNAQSIRGRDFNVEKTGKNSWVHNIHFQRDALPSHFYPFLEKGLSKIYQSHSKSRFWIHLQTKWEYLHSKWCFNTVNETLHERYVWPAYQKKWLKISNLVLPLFLSIFLFILKILIWKKDVRSIYFTGMKRIHNSFYD